MTDTDELDLSKRLPTAEEMEKARQAMHALARHACLGRAVPLCLRDGRDGEAVIELPPAVGQLVQELLMHIGRGEAVHITSFGAEMTTQQAADMLNVSRPFLVKLIETGEIPHHKVGTHRRVKTADVLAYKERREHAREEGLAELARLGQEIDAE